MILMSEPIPMEKVEKINDAASAFKEARLVAWEEFKEMYGEDTGFLQMFKDTERAEMYKAFDELAEQLDLKPSQVGKIWRKAVPF